MSHISQVADRQRLDIEYGVIGDERAAMHQARLSESNQSPGTKCQIKQVVWLTERVTVFGRLPIRRLLQLGDSVSKIKAIYVSHIKTRVGIYSSTLSPVGSYIQG